jgi:mono/diheme cytochrome c family protein
MRSKFPLLLALCAVALVATACFGSGSSESSTSESTAASTGKSSGADLVAGKALFIKTCGGCHTLKDAGTTGQSAPELDFPISAAGVAAQIKAGGGFMPANLLKGADAANVAAYVSSVAGK